MSIRVKEIRDKAIAMEAYFKQAKNPEPERRCCEIRLRAERRAGQLLADIEKAPVAAHGKPGLGRSHKTQSNDTTTFSETPTLSDLGVSKGQSSRWQQLAAVPEEQIENALAAPTKPSTNGIIKSAKPAPDPMDPKAL